MKIAHIAAAAWMAAVAAATTSAPAKADALHGCQSSRGLDVFGDRDVDSPKPTSDTIIDACTRALNYGGISHSEFAVIFNNRAVAYARKTENDKALSDFAAAIHHQPDNFAIYLNRGSLYQAIGNYDRAIDDFSVAIQRFPQFRIAYTNRGIAYGKKGDYDRAIADFGQVIRLSPQYAPGYFDRGVTYENKGDYDRAIPDLDQAARLNPNNIVFLNEACWVRATANRDLATGRAYCDSALSLKSGDQKALNSRGLLGLKQQRYAEAWADYDAGAHGRSTRANDLFGRGIAALRLGRAAEGQADLAAAQKLDPKIAETYAGYGIRP